MLVVPARPLVAGLILPTPDGWREAVDWLSDGCQPALALGVRHTTRVITRIGLAFVPTTLSLAAVAL